ncbi:MAG: FGGY-family carbohydrate kinase [Oscillospiraceae bacterium]|jgi:sugar (pentulose or hexulose) kinase|nr:FGGY-family carbohydrate kinase [Oscillospiraceae bacterium]
MDATIREVIEQGRAYLGIELGSTRIKAVLIGSDHAPIASGGHTWENQYENGLWTYSLDAVWNGLRDAYANLAADVREKYGVELRRTAAMGVSGMMHGYLPFDGEGRLLAPFRTWRNTTTGQAAAELTEKFRSNIPQRWSIAHLHQAVLNGEAHVKDIRFLTTLAGYVHWQLTGEKVMGVGEASGMFPIDSDRLDFDQAMIDQYDGLVSGLNYPWKLRDILPKVLPAGVQAGTMTEAGARLLDPSGTLEAGFPLCPPEGDAGTGMAATNAVAVRTGNVSAGTSVFAMVVLEKPLSRVYEEIDMVTTPAGKPVAMVHCNNCTNELNAWAALFQELMSAMGCEARQGPILDAMFRAALSGEKDGGGTVLYNFLSGEPVAGLTAGRPLLARTPEARLTFANFSRVQLYSALAALKLGLDILSRERVALDRLLGHGGYFKAPEAGQRMLAAAAGAPVSVMETAGEGGPWGMALLAAYSAGKAEGQSLEDYLDSRVFAGQPVTTIQPDPEDAAGFNAFMERYVRAMPAERAAVEHLQ